MSKQSTNPQARLALIRAINALNEFKEAAAITQRDSSGFSEYGQDVKVEEGALKAVVKEAFEALRKEHKERTHGEAAKRAVEIAQKEVREAEKEDDDTVKQAVVKKA